MVTTLHDFCALKLIRKQRKKNVYHLVPWCKKPKHSWALEEILKYNPVSSSPRSNRTNFSTNLEAANRIPTTCSKKSGENKTGTGIYLAASGVP